MLKNGVIDLRNWNFQKDGPVEITGNWKFYWRRFLTSDDIKTSEQDYQLISIPGAWNSVIWNGEKIGAKGYATYSVTVLVGEKTDYLALRFKEVYSAYTVHIDGKEIGSVGTVATSAEKAKEVNNPKIFSFPVEKDQFDLVIHVSNFDYIYGGISSKIALGIVDNVYLKRDIGIAREMSVASIALFVSAFHMALFFFRRRSEIPYLYYGFSLLCFLVYITVTSEWLLFQQTYINSFEILLRTNVISSTLMVLFVSLFVESLYGGMLPKRVTRFQTIFFGMVVILSFFVPVEWMVLVQTGNQILILGVHLTAGISILMAFQKKRKGALFLMAGIMCSLLTFINDLAVYHAFIDSVYCWIYGMTFLCVTENLAVSNRASDAYNNVITLSESLEKSNKRLQKLDELKNDFLARTSHELRTPLSGIIGTTEMVLEESGHLLTKDNVNSLSAVISNGSRLTYLINDILDYSKLRTNEIRIYRTSVDASACARLVTDLLKPLFKRQRITVDNLPAKGLPLVYADDARLQQIFHNLISNAVKFTPAGGTIELSAITKGAMLAIAVKDTGCGIAEEELENVFIPFEQVESANNGKKSGTGLGLSITKNLVELHGGEISITSTVGAGTTVEFLIPLHDEATADNPDKTETPLPPIIPTMTRTHYSPEDDLQNFQVSPGDLTLNTSSPTILIVDDEPINIMVLSKQLTMVGYNTITAISGTVALELIEENEIDLVLLDYMMPDLNGYEVLTKIREMESLPTSFPVIMITAFFHSETAEKCFERGANDYLYKPVKKDDLLMRVKNQLEIKEKIELSERLKTYRKMELEFNRLKHMEAVIDFLDEKIIVAQSKKTIIFSNQLAAKFVGYHPEELRGKNLDLLIPEDSLKRLWQQTSRFNNHSGLKTALLEPRIDIRLKNGERVRTSISISQYKSEAETRYALIIKADEGAEFYRSVKERAVKLMKDSLWLWQTYTGKNKIDLAKESEIWTVSFDTQKGTEKAQTMEKYLKVKTFPTKRPKIDAIIKTVLFVLDQEEIPEEKKEDLKTLLDDISEQ